MHALFANVGSGVSKVSSVAKLWSIKFLQGMILVTEFFIIFLAMKAPEWLNFCCSANCVCFLVEKTEEVSVASSPSASSRGVLPPGEVAFFLPPAGEPRRSPTVVVHGISIFQSSVPPHTEREKGNKKAVEKRSSEMIFP